jgi:hypothetical protein
VDGKASPEVIARRSNLRKFFIANSSGALFVLKACGKMLRIKTGQPCRWAFSYQRSRLVGDRRRRVSADSH